jgi:hypothetical protein
MAVAGLVAGAVLLPFTLAAPATAVLGLVLLTGILESAYGLALAAAYARGDLSLTYPLGRGTAPLLATAWARGLPAAGFAVLVGVVIASYSVVDARAVQEVSPVHTSARPCLSRAP